MDTPPSPPVRSRPPVYRKDGWTPAVQAAFIASLMEQGSVQVAADHARRHVTSAYRQRARNPVFASAWDAARAEAYGRLREEALERVLGGSDGETGYDDVGGDMLSRRSDRLLIAMLNHMSPQRGVF